MKIELAEYGRAVAELMDEKERLEEELKKVGAALHKLTTVTLPSIMEKQEIKKFEIDGVGTVTLRPTVYAHVLKDERTGLYDWLRQNGHGDLVKPYVWPQTLSAWAKEQLAEGKPLPPEVRHAIIPTATLRRK